MASQARARFNNIAGLSPLPTTRSSSNRSAAPRNSINGKMRTDRDGALTLAATYTAAVKSKKAYIKGFESVKSFYIVEAILSALVEDALTPDITTGEVVEVTSQKSAVNKELKKLSKSVNFDQLVRDIAPDLVAHGEYTVKVNIDNEVRVKDTVNQSKVVAFYEDGVPDQFLVEGSRDIYIAKPFEYAHFVMGDFKLRLRMDAFFDEKKQKNSEMRIPEYARIGKPLFYGTISKIKELQLLESLVPASKLNQITRGSIVGVSVPSSSTPQEAFDVCRRYENVFNSSVGVDKVDGDISVSEIIGVAGKVKAVPLFGDKGSLDSIGDTRNNQSVDDLLNTIKDLREIICTSIGFPPELLFGGESKGELLKRYARYLRKLKSIQSALASGIKQIALIHLNNLNDGKDTEPFTVDDISVRFRNELVNIDELEKIEFSDAMVSTVGETYGFMKDLMEDEATTTIVNEKGLHAWLYNVFRLVSTTHDLIHAPDEADIAKRVPGRKATAKITKGDEPEEPTEPTEEPKEEPEEE